MSAKCYRFGPYRFEIQGRQLYREEQRVPLTPKAADLLLALLEHQGRLLAKDELLRVVWGDSFVEEGNLSKHIFILRKTLGQNLEGAPYIETVPKRGYRFVGQVEQPSNFTVESREVEERTREQNTVEGAGASKRPAGWLTFTAVVAAIACGAGWIQWARRPSPAAVPRVLLVLPLANLTGNASDDYFSDGLTEELITAMSGSAGLRVIPRGTAFQFKGRATDARDAAKRLNVDIVLEGGVRHDPEQLRVSLRLLRASDGSALWSQSFSRPAMATISAQQEIARAVLAAIDPHPASPLADRSPGTKNVEAYHMLLRARFAHWDQAEGSLTHALALYREAIRLDPGYADAWAGQAACRFTSGYLFEEAPKPAFEDALTAAQHALSIDPNSAGAHGVLAKVKLFFVHDWAGARREYDTALRLSPNDPEILHSSSHYWVAFGRPDLAAEESRRGLRIDPLNMALNPHEAWLSLMQGEYEEAIRRAQSTLAFSPLHRPTLRYLAAAYEEAGQTDKAVEAQAKLGVPSPVLEDLRTAAASDGASGYCRMLARYFEKTRVRPTAAARLYAIAGDAGEMMRVLQRALREHDSWVVYVNSDPVYSRYRTDPRLQALVRAVGLPVDLPVR